ncbi:MAG: phosphoribosylanthranilate isomerase [Planctomycetes bacterium]|nr:phosphoribosylanthranilate isomerase [Planctomycetota bacterium]
MAETRVKICGLTSPEDATACHALGADLLGVIFAPKSPRRVSRDQAMAIRAAVPEAILVGVFVNEDFDRLTDTAKTTGLDLIQVHGSETPAFCKSLRETTGLPVIRAFRYEDAKRALDSGAFSGLDFLLFDLDKGVPTGQQNLQRLWSLGRKAGAEGLRLFLAGGLDAGNVAEAINETRPYGVDVCRGVEYTPGRKDPIQLKRFIQEAKRCRTKNR